MLSRCSDVSTPVCESADAQRFVRGISIASTASSADVAVFGIRARSSPRGEQPSAEVTVPFPAGAQLVLTRPHLGFGL